MALRVIPPQGPPVQREPIGMAEAVVALAQTVAETNPTLVMIVFESPPGKLNIRALPDNLYVAEILAMRASEMLGALPGED